LKELARQDPRIRLHDKEIDVGNPLEADLLDYIEMDIFDPPAVMVWF